MSNAAKKGSLKTANKIKKRKFIDRDGVITVRIGSELIDVMQFNDFKKSKGITEYDFIRDEKKGIRKRLKIVDRRRGCYFVVVNGDLTEIAETRTEYLTDKDGFFEIVLNGRPRKAMFTAEYSKLNRITKSGIVKRARAKDTRIELVYIKTLCSQRPTQIVLLKDYQNKPTNKSNA